MKLKIFYDGLCPLCSAEINQLRAYDINNQLAFEDIHAADFGKRYPDIDQVRANRVLHGQVADGDLIYGLDVTCMAWKTVGKHRWLSVLRWPGIRWFADLVYLFFARHRNLIAGFFGGNGTNLECQSCKIRSTDQFLSAKRRPCDF